MNAPENPRIFKPSTNSTEPKALFVGLYGPSGGGKTKSALRLASGIQSVLGGEIAVVDTEADRAQHYAPEFKFTHYSFAAPYRSVDYLAALRQLVASGARTIIVDSMSHEHSGPGGVCETHDNLVADKGQNYTFTAWRIAKAGRKQLITAMTTEFRGCCFIFCFRAKDATDFEVKPPRKLGWMPISDDDFLFEMTLCTLLAPGSEGVPTFKSDMVGERQFLKLPGQFRALFQDRRPLDEPTGAALASWARGENKSPATSAVKSAAPPDRQPRQDGAADDDAAPTAAECGLRLAEAAKLGTEKLGEVWATIPPKHKRALVELLDKTYKPEAAKADKLATAQ
jgi:ABC-type dipeptide/oligopeptide/nickel transport system ATPase subunit